MTETAVVPEREDFLPLAEPYRRELQAHCYRMLGSVHDAEDLVQETYLRAWRAYGGFEGRSSLRTWLYRIATSVCLTALETRKRRPLPTGLGAPDSDPAGALVQRPEVPWLEPVPDTMVDFGIADPAAVIASRESVRLAFVAALQLLPLRQRAVLILRDVLAWRAAEVADLLGMTTVAVNSALQRARAQIEAAGPTQDSLTTPLSAEQCRLLDRYVAAFESYDIEALLELLTREVIWEMPPYTGWYRTPAAVVRLILGNCPAKEPGDLRLVPTKANGQPAYATYLRGDDGYDAFQLQVLSLDGAKVSHVASFFDVSLFPTFGLPMSLPL